MKEVKFKREKKKVWWSEEFVLRIINTKSQNQFMP